MKKIGCFAGINIIIITLFNVIDSIIGRNAGIEFIYKYPTFEILIIIVPLYLIICGNIFLPKHNNRLFLYNSLFYFYIIFASNFLTYIIEQLIIDSIFHVMPDLDNLIMFIITTFCQFLLLTFLIFLNLIFNKIKRWRDKV